MRRVRVRCRLDRARLLHCRAAGGAAGGAATMDTGSSDGEGDGEGAEIALPDQGPFYCGVGARSCHPVGRAIVMETLQRGRAAGVAITGASLEVAPGQFELQVRAPGLRAAHDTLLLRYLLARVAERHGMHIELAPKPFAACNGSGCHVTFSTAAMRRVPGPGEPDAAAGIGAIYAAVAHLRTHHAAHIAVYGKGNERRLTGEHETASWRNFSVGVADRGASVRIPRDTERNGCGYLEDRRPASNMDPYLVMACLVRTCLGLA